MKIKTEKKSNKLTKFGQINFGPVIHAVDPCYNKTINYAAWNIKIVAGRYDIYVKYSDTKDWGIRVSELAILHSDYPNFKKLNKTIHLKSIGVDSGQAGFFCDSIYPKGESTGNYNKKGSFYNECCNATLGEGYNSLNEINCAENQLRLAQVTNRIVEFFEERLAEVKKNAKPWLQFGEIFEKGVVSSSGYGDGSYPLYLFSNHYNETVGAKIKYI